MEKEKRCQSCGRTTGVRPVNVKGGVPGEVVYLCAFCRGDRRYAAVRREEYRRKVYGEPKVF